MRLTAFIIVWLTAVLSGGCSSLVSGPIEENPGKRSLGAAIDDQIIETKAKVNIRAAHADLDRANFDAISYNGILLLVGQVPSEAVRTLAAQTAAKVKRVRRVHNELAVTGKTSFLVRANDGWISTKVRTRLALSDDLDSARIKVTTENGIVYLMGLVNAAEADAAAEVARQTNGVQRVVRVFEYF